MELHLDLAGKTPPELLKIWRQANLLSQDAFADHLGVSRIWYGAIERGEVRPNLEVATKIEKLTGISATSWITDGEAEKVPA